LDDRSIQDKTGPKTKKKSNSDQTLASLRFPTDERTKQTSKNDGGSRDASWRHASYRFAQKSETDTMTSLILKRVLKKVGIFFEGFTEENVDISILKGELNVRDISALLALA
jgi:hypothetical protein